MNSIVRIDKVAWICIRDKRVLCVRSRWKHQFFMPGGKREWDETDAQTLSRELFEELGIILDPFTLCYYGTFEAQAASDQIAGTMLRETCYTAEYVWELSPQAEIEEIGWFDYDAKTTLTPLGQLLWDDLRTRKLI